MHNFAAVIASIAVIYLPRAFAGTKDKPTIILIHADDFGYGDLHANYQPCALEKLFNSTCPNPKTDNLDKLAAEGIRFTDWYAPHPVCTPSRAALHTGRYPIRTGAFPGVFNPSSQDGLPASEVMLPQLMRDVGYSSYMVGKWHLGHVRNPHQGGYRSFLPVDRGYDSWTGLAFSHDFCPCPANLTLTDDHTCRPDDPPCALYGDYQVNQQPAQLYNLDKIYGDQAIRYIDQSISDDKPLFLYLAPQHTHHPQFAARDDINASAHAGGRPDSFGDSALEMDVMIGRVMDHVRARAGDLGEVHVFATSDNGPSLIRHQDGGNPGSLKCGKGTTWDGGQRVMGIYWSQNVPKARHGVVESSIASTIDLLPTVCSISGCKTPTDRPIDGVDISPLLFTSTGREGEGEGEGEGEKSSAGAPPRDHFFYYGLTGTMHAARVGKYKAHFYTTIWGTSPPELCTLPGYKFGNYSQYPILFDLEADIGETKPIDNSTQEYATALATIMQRVKAHNCFRQSDKCAGTLEPYCDSQAETWPPKVFHPWTPKCPPGPNDTHHSNADLLAGRQAVLIGADGGEGSPAQWGPGPNEAARLPASAYMAFAEVDSEQNDELSLPLSPYAFM